MTVEVPRVAPRQAPAIMLRIHTTGAVSGRREQDENASLGARSARGLSSARRRRQSCRACCPPVNAWMRTERVPVVVGASAVPEARAARRLPSRVSDATAGLWRLHRLHLHPLALTPRPEPEPLTCARRCYERERFRRSTSRTVKSMPRPSAIRCKVSYVTFFLPRSMRA